MSHGYSVVDRDDHFSRWGFCSVAMMGMLRIYGWPDREVRGRRFGSRGQCVGWREVRYFARLTLANRVILFAVAMTLGHAKMADSVVRDEGVKVELGVMLVVLLNSGTHRTLSGCRNRRRELYRALR